MILLKIINNNKNNNNSNTVGGIKPTKINGLNTKFSLNSKEYN